MKERQPRETAAYGAPALEKGLDILEFLAHSSQAATQKEIAGALGRSPNETYRMLAVLERRGYLRRDGVSGKYALSLRLYHLAHTHDVWESLRSLALPHLKELAQAAGQSCHLAVQEDLDILILARARSPHPVALSIQEGARLPLHQTASGKVLLAHMTDQTRREIVQGLARAYQWDKNELRHFEAKTEEVRLRGFVQESSAYTAGVTDISVPVGSAGSPLQAALTLPCLATTLAEPRDDGRLLELAKSAAAAIAADAGLPGAR